MPSFFHKLRLPALLLGGIIVLALAVLFGLRKTVTLEVNGSSHQVTTYALRVSDLLYSQGLSLSPQDYLSPSLDTWLKRNQTISIMRAIPVEILADGTLTRINSPERNPAVILAINGISLKPGDLLLSNGQTINPSRTFSSDKQAISIQVVRSVSFTISADGKTKSLTSAASTLGSALWSEGYKLYSADYLSPTVDATLSMVSAATLVRSTPFTIQTQFGNVSTRTAASTIGDALLAAHLSPQGLDYTLPTLAEPVPSGQAVRLIRVSEQVIIEQTSIPFKNEFQPASDLELDSQSVIQAGEVGMSAQRVRVRYEDGEEAARSSDSQWVAREPQPRIIGYGTNIVMHTTTVDGVTIQYWRSVTMYATSYHPSEVGDTTASGMKLKKGVVAVDTSIIPFYTQLYIPGYGQAVAADIGGGVHGRMIDLGYSDNDYVPWHSTVTVYFLWPPPANIVYVIP